jgi:ABC-type sugar transport system substrate-binding protein
VLTRLFIIALCSCWIAPAALAQNVVFLNPGKADEDFWVSVSRFMEAAAGDLGMRVEVLYAERDPARMVVNARAVIARAKKPDYLVVVNEKQVGNEVVRLCAGTDIKVFFLLNDLSPQQRDTLRGESGAMARVVGSLVPDNEEAGYQMAQALIDEGRRKGLIKPGIASIIAIGGDKATPAAMERDAGLRRALAENPDVLLGQQVYGEWSQERAAQQAQVLLIRYPEARMIWAANDLMAFGAMDAAQARGLTPGQSVLVTGLNNSDAAMEARASGRLSVLVTGHFLAGGWAMVMLHDLSLGVDLDRFGGRFRREALFTPLDQRQARRFLEVFGEGRMPPLDFRRFSLADRPAADGYQFSLVSLLK